MRRALLGFVDNTHPTLAKYTDNPVATDRFRRIYRQQWQRLNGVGDGYRTLVLRVRFVPGICRC